jgi:RecJ-like exonuclease
MHKADPMEIMLSEIFEEVFYKRQYKDFVKFCPDCDGWGKREVEVARPHNFNRDVGCLDTKQIPCSTCTGTGFTEYEG